MKINDVYLPYLDNQSRYLVLYGGAGSGKSWFAAQKMLLRLTTESGQRLLFFRKVAKTIKESVFGQFKRLLNDTGIIGEFDINTTEKTFYHRPTGNEIICMGLDDPEKLKSIHGITSVWVEEATELTKDDLDQLDLRLRGKTENYKQIILTFNPIHEGHWLKARFVDKPGPDTTVLHTTFKDNHLLDDEYREVLESLAGTNENFYRIYKEGRWGLPQTDKPWAYAFTDKHISDQIKLNPRETVYLSFDFNISPMTCTAHQYAGLEKYWTLYEFRSNNTGTEELCRMILGSEIGDCHFVVTGDATGRNRNAMSGNLNNYQIILQVLGLGRGQIKVPMTNPGHQESQTLTNSIFARHKGRLIHPRCKYLIEDLRYVESNDKHHPVVADKSMGHLLDGVRYMDNTFFPNFIKQSRRIS